MSDDDAHGRRDGLRLALAILAREEAKWAALLGESPAWRTNAIRTVRYKTLQVAQTRVQTALNGLTPNNWAAVERVGVKGLCWQSWHESKPVGQRNCINSKAYHEEPSAKIRSRRQSTSLFTATLASDSI